MRNHLQCLAALDCLHQALAASAVVRWFALPGLQSWLEPSELGFQAATDQSSLLAVATLSHQLGHHCCYWADAQDQDHLGTGAGAA